MTSQRDFENVQKAILDVVRLRKKCAGLTQESAKQAPQYAHDMLDAMLSAKKANDPSVDMSTFASTGWAHALLDEIWVLI